MIEIHGYSVSGQIGRGGMATVYRARQTLLDREVALKVMSRQLAQDPIYAQRFLQEARMLAALNHPHVVPVYDVGVTPEGLHYFSMQLLGGGDFAARMRDGLSELELVRVLLAVAHALGFAHARGYVHRDVTPANILFDAHDTPILTDFGIARAVTATSRITASGLSIGTSHYMSPEQARGAEADHRSDIYSLGVLCFEAVAGRPPFEGEDGFAVAFSHVHDAVPRLPDEVARWQPLIDRAMAKDPADRFADCAAFIEGLREVAPQEFNALGPTVVSAQTRRVLTAPARPLRLPRLPKLPRLAWPAALRRRPEWLGRPGDWLAALRPAHRPGLPVFASGAIGAVLLGVAIWIGSGGSDQSLPASSAEAAEANAAGGSSGPASPAAVPVALQQPGAAEPAALPPTLPAASENAAVPAPTGDPDPAGALLAVTEELHTVVDPVAELVARGRANIERLRLTNPPMDNAFERFKLALQIEPDNADAAQGIVDVARAYLGLADRSGPNEDFDGWLGYLRSAEQVAAAHPAAADSAAAARAMRRAFASQRVEVAEDALRDWDRPTASAAFKAALKAEPGLAAAQRGLDEVERVGTVGYRFRDRLTDGEGPELVIVSEQLALGRHEVTVAEFEVWWNAVGKARFGGDMPRCRDRESGAVATFLSGNGKDRDWTSPDIEQDGRHPVVCISQPMAAAYAVWLSERSGRHYRLPTVAELEPHAVAPTTACRANLRDAAYRTAFGDREGVDCDDAHAGTAPVGSFGVTPSGLVDAYGNVREWTIDCPGSCRDHIAVGLGWHSSPGEPLTAPFRNGVAYNTIGFRLARVIDRTDRR